MAHVPAPQQLQGLTVHCVNPCERHHKPAGLCVPHVSRRPVHLADNMLHGHPRWHEPCLSALGAIAHAAGCQPNHHKHMRCNAGLHQIQFTDPHRVSAAHSPKVCWSTLLRQGIVATVAGRAVAVGNARLLAGQGVRVGPSQAVAEVAWQARGGGSLRICRNLKHPSEAVRVDPIHMDHDGSYSGRHSRSLMCLDSTQLPAECTQVVAERCAHVMWDNSSRFCQLDVVTWISNESR